MDKGINKVYMKWPAAKDDNIKVMRWIGDEIVKAHYHDFIEIAFLAGISYGFMRNYENLHADISATSGFTAMTRDPEFSYKFIEEFQNRIYFGTDICAPENDYRLSFWLDDAVNTNKISKSAYEKICRGNVLKILEG